MGFLNKWDGFLNNGRGGEAKIDKNNNNRYHKNVKSMVTLVGKVVSLSM